jgi:hypothetical protein
LSHHAAVTNGRITTPATAADLPATINGMSRFSAACSRKQIARSGAEADRHQGNVAL